MQFIKGVIFSFIWLIVVFLIGILIISNIVAGANQQWAIDSDIEEENEGGIIEQTPQYPGVSLVIEGSPTQLGTQGVFQGFTASSTSYITSVNFFLGRTPIVSPTITLIARLYTGILNEDNFIIPSGSPLCSSTTIISQSDLPITGIPSSATTFNFDGTTQIIQGQIYAVGVEVLTGSFISNSNCYTTLTSTLTYSSPAIEQYDIYFNANHPTRNLVFLLTGSSVSGSGGIDNVGVDEAYLVWCNMVNYMWLALGIIAFTPLILVLTVFSGVLGGRNIVGALSEQ